MSNRETVHDLFTWAQELQRTGDSRDADNAMLKQQLQRGYTETMRGMLAVLMTAREAPEILDAAISMLEKVLQP